MPEPTPTAELIELDMHRPGRDRVLLDENTGDIVFLSAEWWTLVDQLAAEGGEEQ